ncbi:hypothetical protein D3C77_289670 [compost metagenome]
MADPGKPGPECFHLPSLVQVGRLLRGGWRSPVLEPSRPKFRHDLRQLRLFRGELGIMIVRVGPEVRAFNRPFHSADARNQRNIDPSGDQSVAKMRHIITCSLVIMKITVFVLYLHENDVPSLRMLALANDRNDPVKVQVDVFQKCRIVSPVTNPFLLPQPPWKAAKIPFRAYVRARPGDYPQAELSAQIEKGAAVLIAAKIPLPFLRLMHVPGKIGVYTVHASLFGSP